MRSLNNQDATKDNHKDNNNMNINIPTSIHKDISYEPPSPASTGRKIF